MVKYSLNILLVLFYIIVPLMLPNTVLNRQENRELLEHLKEGLSLMSKAYKLVIGTPTEAVLETLLLKYINKVINPLWC